MVFYPKYPQEVFDYIKTGSSTGKALQAEIKDKFGYDIPRNSLSVLIYHHRYGKPYKHGKCTPSWHLKPLGTERKDKDGYILVRVEGGEKRKHFIEWEKYHEPTKSDECLIFLDGNRENCDISNLYLMKRKYMGAVNDILKNCTSPELRKAAIAQAMLKVEVKEKQIVLNKNNPHHKPKSDKWRDVVLLYRQGKTTPEIADILKRDKGTIGWIIRRYKLGFYE